MIKNELKQVIVEALKLDGCEMQDDTTASEVPGWDSLSHVNIILAVEKRFGVRFKSLELLKLKNVGEKKFGLFVNYARGYNYVCMCGGARPRWPCGYLIYDIFYSQYLMHYVDVHCRII